MSLFLAGFAYGGYEEGVLMAGLADDEFQTVSYLLLQRDDSGQLHVTIDDEMRSGYGDILSVAIESDRVEFVLSDDLASLLGCDPRFDIKLRERLEGLPNFLHALAEMGLDISIAPSARSQIYD